jgi:hypothetical protein
LSIYNGIDFSGQNLGDAIPNSTLKSCLDACNSKPECVASVLGKENNLCYLKSSIDQPSINANRIISIKRSTLSNVQKATLNGIDYSGNNITEIKNSNLNDCIAACDANNDCVASVFGSDNNYCWLKSSIDKPSANSNRKITVKPVKNQDLQPAASIKCIANDPLGNNSGAVYRYTNNNNNQTIFHYPNPDIANTWDSKWSDAKPIDCSGITLSSDVKAINVSSGTPIKCATGIPNGQNQDAVWRFTNNTNNPTINYYPNADIANSFDKNWNNISTIDCTGMKVGPNLSSITQSNGAAVGCKNNDPKGDNSGAVYRLDQGMIQHYPNPTIASSWDKDWGKFTKIDCSGLVLGKPLPQKIYTNSGNSLSNWNVSSTSLGDANIGGYNTKAIIVANDGSCTREIQQSFLNTVIKFKVCIGAWIDIRFACGAAGDGTALRLDTRLDNKSGFATVNSWTSYESLQMNGPVLNSRTWYNVLITIDSIGRARYYIEGIWQGNMGSIKNNGNYIGLIAGGGETSYFTDISIMGSSTYAEPPKIDGMNLYFNCVPDLNLNGWINPATGSNKISISDGWFQAAGNGSIACLALRSLRNTSISFMVYSEQLCNFFFGCDRNGKGFMLRLDARNGATSGFTSTNSWTSGNRIDGPTIPPNVWLNIQINIDNNGTATWYINGIIIRGSIAAVDSSNTFIAISGDFGGGTSAFTNLSISYPAKGPPPTKLDVLLNSSKLDGWSAGSSGCTYNQLYLGKALIDTIGCAGNGKVSIRDLGQSIFNRTIRFQFNTDNLGDFFFGCDNTGKGFALRLDGRGSNFKCGFMTTSNWSTWSGTSDGFYINRGNWYSIIIKINAFGICTYFISFGGFVIARQTIQLPPNAGTYIGLQGDNGGGYSYWRNIQIQ